MLFITSLIFVVISSLFTYDMIQELYMLNLEKTLTYVVFLIITFFLLAKFMIHRKGFVIDGEKDTLEFPGGGLEANDVSGVFNIARFFRRNSVTLSQIEQIGIHTITDRELEGSFANTLPPIVRDMLCPKHLLLANGNFGTLKLNFYSKGKRDLLYTAIVQINEMGTPVVHR